MALKHAVTDTDNNFSINPVTRVIKNESTTKTLLVQYDHNSERFSFELPREVEGHEMDKCDKVEVHFVNIDAKTQLQSAGVYTVEDLTVSDQDGSVVIFSWLISQNATKYVGSLNFLVRFVCLDDDGELLYVWNTAIHSGIMISNGIYNSEFVLEQYVDALEQWKAQCTAFRLLNLEQTKESTESEGENEWTATFDGMEPKKFVVRNGKQGEQGKSAYEVAKDNGFEGTEEEWLASLRPQTITDENGNVYKNITYQLTGTTLNMTVES